MTTKKLITLTLLGLSFAGIKAQDKILNTPNETKELSQKVSQLFKENKVGDAFKILKSYWPIPANEVDGMEEKTIVSLKLRRCEVRKIGRN